jgi:hypothetical protein
MIPGSKLGTPFLRKDQNGVPVLDLGSSNDLYGVSHKLVTLRSTLDTTRWVGSRVGTCDPDQVGSTDPT